MLLKDFQTHSSINFSSDNQNRAYSLVRTLALSLIFLVFAKNNFATTFQNPILPGEEIDKLVKQRLSAVAPGGVVLIAKNGKNIFQKAYGKANIRTGQPMNKDMVFRIGSVTKQFTAVAILQLVEQGKLSLNEAVQKYVKDFPRKRYPITIENLLTQTSGIINYQAIEHPKAKYVHENYTPAQGVDYFKDEPLLFKPGTKFNYSNSNYYLLGYIIEKVTGKPYPEYLRQHILKPLGLNHTSYISSRQPVANIPAGYSRFGSKQWENAELQNVTTLYAAGGLLSNAEDLLKWHNALLEGRVISKSMLKKAYTAFRLADGRVSEYGYGWYLRSLDGQPTIEHGGSTDGYETDEIYLPSSDIYVVTLFNAFEADMDWTVLSNDITRLASGKQLRQEITISDKELKKYVGTYYFNSSHQLVISYKNHHLFVNAVNPKDNLPKVQLHAKTPKRFYIVEANLEFEFEISSSNKPVKMTTYNNSRKDAEWKLVH